MKKVAIAIVALVAAFLIIPLFLAQDYTVERDIVINKSKNATFHFIKHLKNQDKFSVWALKDPSMEKSYKGTDGTVGFVSAWKSEMEDLGTGEQEIKKIVEGERIDFELRFIEPFEATSQAYMTTEAIDGNQTKLTWGFHGHMDYPMNIMLLFMDMESYIAKDFSDGLTNLKNHLEK